ncbi:MAG: DUF4019 domain-containing protein [Acidobacteria bacterium]|nr:DUF4019 domain-containing protein [Acidobacteriota bacterium]
MRAGVRSQEPGVRKRIAFAELFLNSSLQHLCFIGLVALLILTSACALKASRGGIPPQAQATIDAVNADIAEGRYEKIYTEAADEWRQATTLEQSNATFKTLKDKLGSIKSRSYHSATEQDTTGGHSFTITYTTSFERAEGMETFTLAERDGRWLLARYFVNSDALK